MMVAIRQAYRCVPGCVTPPQRLQIVRPELSPNRQLLADIEAFLRRHPEISQTRFGREACANDKIVPHLQAGKEPRAATENRIRAYMRSKDAR